MAANDGNSRQSGTTFELAKRATVAIAFMLPEASPSQNAPFKIAGSGFCIDQRGVIITCRHVLQPFIDRDLDTIPTKLPGGKPRKERVKAITPFAIFYIIDPKSTQMIVECASLATIETTPERDVCMARVSPIARFGDSFPAMEIEDFSAVHEGMEIATCGFPLGNVLSKALGTMTSSFTRGSLSSIVPLANASREVVKGFQLDLRTTHGNSGGPVFSASSGKAIGILQGGTVDPYGHQLFSYAESVYWPLDRKMIEHVINPLHPRVDPLL